MTRQKQNGVLDIEEVRNQTSAIMREIQQETYHAGYREGRIEARISIIRRMRRAGMEWKAIENITGISWEDYRDLQGYWPPQVQ